MAHTHDRHALVGEGDVVPDGVRLPLLRRNPRLYQDDAATGEMLSKALQSPKQILHGLDVPDGAADNDIVASVEPEVPHVAAPVVALAVPLSRHFQI